MIDSGTKRGRQFQLPIRQHSQGTFLFKGLKLLHFANLLIKLIHWMTARTFGHSGILQVFAMCCSLPGPELGDDGYTAKPHSHMYFKRREGISLRNY